MLTYILFGIVVLLIVGKSGFHSAEKALLMSHVANEQDPAARMMKVQAVTQLDNIQDEYLRAKVVTSIIQK
jgi:hypothetical protein